MPANGEYTAVVDRFEGELAVLLLESNGETVDDIAVHRAELPEEGRHQDAILRVSIEDGELQEATYKVGETDERAEHAQSRFDRLSRRPSETESDTEPE